jgi:hypothetical protein
METRLTAQLSSMDGSTNSSCRRLDGWFGAGNGQELPQKGAAERSVGDSVGMELEVPEVAMEGSMEGSMEEARRRRFPSQGRF